jgi:hypothetical protein
MLILIYSTCGQKVFCFIHFPIAAAASRIAYRSILSMPVLAAGILISEFLTLFMTIPILIGESRRIIFFVV